MIEVNEYKSLHGVFNRYAKQFEDNPKTARFVNPRFISIGKEDILKSIDVIKKQKIDEFKIINRDHTVLYCIFTFLLVDFNTKLSEICYKGSS